MQQMKVKTKVKSDTEKKNQKSIAKMMAQMDKKQTEDIKNREIPKDYYEILRKPRSERYLQLVQEQMQISADMDVVAGAIQEVEEVLETLMSENSTQKSSEEVIEISQETIQLNEETASTTKAWWEEDAKEETQERLLPKEWWEQEIVSVKKSAPEWTTQNIDLSEVHAKRERKRKELEAKKERLQKEYEALGERLEERKKQIESEVPVNGKLGMIYCSEYESTLMNYGFIAVPGSPFFSEKDLLEQVQPQSEQEEKQWCAGNRYYLLHSEERKEPVLAVEVYMYAICIVYQDGHTRVYEDGE